MDKSDIRTQGLDVLARHEIDPDSEAQLYERVLDAFPVDDLIGKTVGFYWPMGHEVDCTYLIELFLKNNIQLVLPVVKKDTKVLSFYQWDGKSPLVSGSLKTKEPPTDDSAEAVIPDVVFHPMIAFDRYGTRLGRGGGYYDATFEHLRDVKRSVICVGLAFDIQLCLFPLPKEDHDQSPDIIITPTQTYKFA